MKILTLFCSCVSAPTQDVTIEENPNTEYRHQIKDTSEDEDIRNLYKNMAYANGDYYPIPYSDEERYMSDHSDESYKKELSHTARYYSDDSSSISSRSSSEDEFLFLTPSDYVNNENDYLKHCYSCDDSFDKESIKNDNSYDGDISSDVKIGEYDDELLYGEGRDFVYNLGGFSKKTPKYKQDREFKKEYVNEKINPNLIAPRFYISNSTDESDLE